MHVYLSLRPVVRCLATNETTTKDSNMFSIGRSARDIISFFILDSTGQGLYSLLAAWLWLDLANLEAISVAPTTSVKDLRSYKWF